MNNRQESKLETGARWMATTANALGHITALTEVTALATVGKSLVRYMEPSFITLGSLAWVQAAASIASTRLSSDDANRKIQYLSALPGVLAGTALLLVGDATINGVPLQPIVFSVASTAGTLIQYANVKLNIDPEKTVKNYISLGISGAKTLSLYTLIYSTKIMGGNVGDNLATAQKGEELSPLAKTATWIAAGATVAHSALSLFSSKRKNNPQLQSGLQEVLVKNDHSINSSPTLSNSK